MMDVQGILNKIESDAREAAAAVLADAQKRAEAMRAQGDARAQAQREATDARVRGDSAEMKGRMLRMAELEDKKAQLQVKREVMDRAFSQALEDLKRLPPEKKRAFFLDELLSVARGDETVCPGAEESAWLDATFLEKANAALRQAGKPGALKTGEKIPGCGFELRRGGEALTCTFEALVSGNRMALEGDVARKLFQD